MHTMNSTTDRPVVIHLVDHQPPGAIFPLLVPLARMPNHHVMTSFPGRYAFSDNRFQQAVSSAGNRPAAVIVHSSGRRLPLFSRFEDLLSRFPVDSFVFMHVSPTYLDVNGRSAFLKQLHQLRVCFGTAVLAPSAETADLYSQRGIPAQPVQLGISGPTQVAPYVGPLSGRRFIVTTCGYPTSVYEFVKGVDVFTRIIHELHLESIARILGHDSSSGDGVVRTRLSHRDVFTMLSQARVYVQLSTTETYNLTAVEAKRMRVPVIVSNVEGHRSNVRHGFLANSPTEAMEQLLRIVADPSNAEVRQSVEANWQDTMTRETVAVFARSLEDATSRSLTVSNRPHTGLAL